MNTKEAKGSCLCGAVFVTFPIAAEVFDACHCGMCRKWGGGPTLTVDGAGAPVFSGGEFISRYESSAWAERGFCKRCGTHLFYRLKSSGFCNFSLGIVDGNERFTFHKQIFVDKKPDNYSFTNKTEMMTEAQIFAKDATT